MPAFSFRGGTTLNRDTLSFDIYQRYAHIAEIVTFFTPVGKTAEILDVGGQQRLLELFLPEQQIVVADLEPIGTERAIQADGCALPFKDGAFDYSISIDTLEHVPLKRRSAFIEELLRVSQTMSIVAFPVGNPINELAEQAVMEFHETLTGTKHQYLCEHEQNKLPTLDWLRRLCKKLHISIQLLPNGYTPYWLLSMVLNNFFSHLSAGAEAVHACNKLYNLFLQTADRKLPSYRCVAMLSRKPIPTFINATNLTSDRLEALFQQIKEITRRFTAIVNEQNHLRNHIAKVEAANADQNETILQLQKTQEWMTDQITRLTHEKQVAATESTSHIHELLVHTDHLASDLKAQKAAYSELEQHDQSLQNEQSKLHNRIVELESYTRHLEQALSESQNQVEQTQTRLNSDIKALLTQVAAKTQECEDAKSFVAHLREQLSLREQDIDELRLHTGNLEVELTRNNDELNKSAAYVARLEQTLSSQEQLYKELTLQYTEKANYLSQLESEFADRERLYHEAKEYALRLEGEQSDIKREYQKLADAYENIASDYEKVTESYQVALSEISRLENVYLNQAASLNELTAQRERLLAIQETYALRIKELEPVIPLYEEAVTYSRHVESELIQQKRYTAELEQYVTLYHSISAYVRKLETELANRSAHIEALERYIDSLLGEIKRLQEARLL